VTAIRRVGRWLRNHGFVFTELQVLSRWDDIGGPRRYELWTLSNRWRYATHRAWIHGVSGVVGVVLMGLLLGMERSEIVRFATVMGLGGTVAMFFGAALLQGQWRRRRALYNGWLRRRAYRDAKAKAKAVPT
jgi:hypothetical protein